MCAERQVVLDPALFFFDERDAPRRFARGFFFVAMGFKRIAFGGVGVGWVLQTESVLRTYTAFGRCWFGEARQGWASKFLIVSRNPC